LDDVLHLQEAEISAERSIPQAGELLLPENSAKIFSSCARISIFGVTDLQELRADVPT
jgi:hypothetical protein